MTDESFETIENLPTIKGSNGGESKILAGRYKIIRQLGHGGMGLVYLAEDTELDNEKVAIKFIPPTLAGNVRAIKNLKKEAQTARQLSHKNIVRLHDLHTDSHQKFLVMEYIDGKTLEQILVEKQDDKFRLEELLPIARQIAEGLEYAHNCRVLHRDLKPSNVMIEKSGKVKLLDFGIAREMKDSYISITGKETSGTLPYMSPQQLMGEQPNISMDIYSFGAVLYECLSGHPPFYMGDIREQIKSKMPADISSVGPAVNNAVQSALSKNPARRPASPSDLVAMLEGKKKAFVYKDTLDYAQTINIKAEKTKAREKKTKIVIVILILFLCLAGTFVVSDYLIHRQQLIEAEKKQQDDLFKAWNNQNDAEKAAENGDYTQAIMLLDKLIAEYPNTQNASWASAKKPIWQKILENKQKQQLQVAALFSEAEKYKNEGSLNKSVEAVEQILVLDPANKEAKKLQIELISEIEKHKSEAERQKSFKAYFADGNAFESKQDWEKAIEAYTKSLAVRPDDAGAKDKLASCQHNLFVQKAQESEQQNDFNEAINYYTKAISYKQVEATQIKLDSVKQKILQNRTEKENCLQKYSEWLKKAQDSEKEGNLSNALMYYQKAQEFTDESLKAKIDFLIARIAEIEKQKKFEANKQNALEADKQKAIEADKKKKLEAERQKKCAALISYAKARDDKEQGKDALRALDEALELCPDNQEALALKKKISGYYSISSGQVITNSIGMKLVFIPAGKFLMGSPASENQRDNDEGPQHYVTISKGFYIGVCEITQAQYKTIMGNNRSNFKGDTLPVEEVSWYDAVEFCKKLSRKESKTYRLPTEAEWEYACRAGTTTPFNTGQTISTGLANYYGYYFYGNGQTGIYREKTTEVGSFPPNNFGLYDMHGNVWEWCSDWYDNKYYSNSSEVDPQGPAKGKLHTIRGGSWLNTWGCRSALRFKDSPDSRSSDYGFRVVMEADSASSVKNQHFPNIIDK